MEKLILINPYIHQEAKLKKEKFLERIRNIKFLRTNDFSSDFLIGTCYQWDLLNELHNAINKGIFNFSFSSNKLFTFEIEKDIYDWFRNNNIQTIQKQIINWNAALYLAKPEQKDFFETEIYGVVFNEIRRVIDKYYTDSNSIESYEKASLEYINCLPPNFLKNPFKESVVVFNDWGPWIMPKLKLEIGYFTKTDWICIVERDMNKFRTMHKIEIDKRLMTEKDIQLIFEKYGEDSLQRAESNKKIFNNWLYSYKKYEQTQNHIFRLFDNEVRVGFIYIIRQRNTSFFKIGWTEKKETLTFKESVEKRVASLQTGNPEKLDIIGYFRASSIKTEKTIHEKFKKKRKTGEWFLLSENDYQNILNDDWRIANNIF